MPPVLRTLWLPTAAIVAALALGACGTEGIEVSEDDPTYDGAVLFAERCSGCHTMKAAGAQGSANRTLRNQGPNLDQRTETVDDVLYAIRNGGFSGAIMPQNILVGDEAEAVAEFVAEYAGSDVEEPNTPGADQDAPASDARPSMLDLRAIRDDPAAAREALARRGAAEQLDELLALDARRRELLPEAEGRRARQNEASEQIAAGKRAGEDVSEVIERMKAVSAELKQLQTELAEVEARRDALAATLPNLPDPAAPDGGEDDAVTLREVGDAAELRVRGPRPPRARHRARLDRDREGGRGLGITLRLSARRPGDGRVGAGALRASSWSAPRASSPSSRRCWFARGRSTAPATFPPSAR